MKPRPVLPRIIVFITVAILSFPAFLSAQPEKKPARIAVLRMKSIGVTDANRQFLKTVPGKLNSALAASKAFDVPDWKRVLEVLDDEGIEPEDLIDLDDFIDAAEELKADFFVIGSMTHRAQTLYSHARVYSMPKGSLVGVLSADLGADRLDELIDQLATRIGQIVQQPGPARANYARFRWSEQFSFSFGTDRLDLSPPVIYFINDDPPFEIGVKVNMDRLGGMYVVTHFEMYADGEPVAIILADTEAPRPLREREVEIDGHPFCFQAVVKELRGRFGESISTAVVQLSARSCAKD